MKEHFWYDEVFKDLSRLGLKATDKLFDERSELQHVEIIDTIPYGRVLAIDETFMTSEKDEHFYHEMLVHPALTTAPQLKRVLVIGGGDGGTVREVLTYPEVEQVVMVEIDRLVVEACRRFLPSIGRAWDDPRLQVLIADGIKFVKKRDIEPFNVILLDGCDPIGPAKGLFTLDFYRNCAALLADDGVFALQTESPILQRTTFLDIGQALSQVFKKVHPYFGPAPIYPSGTWSWIYATQSIDHFSPRPDRAMRQEERCKYYNRDIHRAAFALPNDLKKIFQDGAVKIPED